MNAAQISGTKLTMASIKKQILVLKVRISNTLSSLRETLEALETE